MRAAGLILLLTGMGWSQEGVRFLPAGECALCHTEVPSGAYPLWRRSMMAKSAEDPYWQWKVADEVRQAPARQAEIEDKCLRCHAPAQQYALRGKGGLTLAKLDELGKGGVSCTVCHQISAQGLGSPESFTGGFRIGTGAEIWGPHERPFTMPMLHHTGYQATFSAHIEASSLCATCHTVENHLAGGGTMVEQGPYLEWLDSQAALDGKSCQSCHMPRAEGPAYIAHRPMGGAFPPTRHRAPVHRHEFIGANTVVPEMLGMPETAGRARQQLARGVDLEAVLDGDQLRVTVTNRTGHKLPTGFPSRRLWVRVRSEEGAVAAPPEAEFGATYLDRRSAKTTSLLQAVRYGRDSRIPPAGKAGTGRAVVPFSVTKTARRFHVEAVFQTVGPEWAPSGVEWASAISKEEVVAVLEVLR